MPGELLFRSEPAGFLFATLIHQPSPLLRAMWTPIGPPHRRIVPALMRRAAAGDHPDVRLSQGRPRVRDEPRASVTVPRGRAPRPPAHPRPLFLMPEWWI